MQSGGFVDGTWSGESSCGEESIILSMLFVLLLSFDLEMITAS